VSESELCEAAYEALCELAADIYKKSDDFERIGKYPLPLDYRDRPDIGMAIYDRLMQRNSYNDKNLCAAVLNKHASVNVLNRLFSRSIQQSQWDTSVWLAQNVSSLEEQWGNFLKKSSLTAEDEGVTFEERLKCFSVLAYLAENGDGSIIDKYAAILTSLEDQSALTPQQFAAVHVLMRINTAVSNAILFATVQKVVDPKIQNGILEVLSRENRHFLNSTLRSSLGVFSKQSRDCIDLAFVSEILSVPSSELRGLLLEKSASAVLRESHPWTKLNSSSGGNIPKVAFERVWSLQKLIGNSEVITTFDTLYANTKRESIRANLLYAITHLCEVRDQDLLKNFVSLLLRMDMQEGDAAVMCSVAMRKVAFLDSAALRLTTDSYDDDDQDDEVAVQEMPITSFAGILTVQILVLAHNVE
jgi:hypothetical protein